MHLYRFFLETIWKKYIKEYLPPKGVLGRGIISVIHRIHQSDAIRKIQNKKEIEKYGTFGILEFRITKSQLSMDSRLALFWKMKKKIDFGKICLYLFNWFIQIHLHYLCFFIVLVRIGLFVVKCHTHFNYSALNWFCYCISIISIIIVVVLSYLHLSNDQ